MSEFEWRDNYGTCDWHHICDYPWCDNDYGHCDRLDSDEQDCREETCPIMKEQDATKQD